jgi:hypothetical protein
MLWRNRENKIRDGVKYVGYKISNFAQVFFADDPCAMIFGSLSGDAYICSDLICLFVNAG